MEILQLRYFYESAKTENFARTAEKYLVPATSVSASVKRLEKELGCKLFHRSCNRIMLNDNGKKLKQSLSVIFEELDEVVDSLSSTSIDTREIKMLVRAMRGEITDYIIEYKLKNPHIVFKTDFNFDETNFEKYDIIIDEITDKYPHCEKIDLYTTKIRLEVSAKSQLFGKKLTLKQLSNQSFVSIGENSSMHKILINACNKAGFVPDIIVQTNDLECNRKFVEAGIGIGLGREYPRAKLSNNIKYLNIIDFDEKQTICSYYRKESNYGNVKHFLNFLKSKAMQTAY